VGEQGLNVLAAQAVIGPQGPSLKQWEGAVVPRQDDVRRHLPDDARIIPAIAVEIRKGKAWTDKYNSSFVSEY
jgi:hypothetical protein